MDHHNGQLDELFARYREACPDPLPGSNFMPALWRRIDARRSSRFRLLRLSRLFLSAATGIWLVLVGVLLLPAPRAERAPASYVDALAASPDGDLWTYAEASRVDLGASGAR